MKGYIVGGFPGSDKSGDKTENGRGGDDYWMVKLDRAGRIQWNKTIGGSENDWASNIKEINKPVCSGGTSLSGISGDKKKKARGGKDYWLVWLTQEKQCPINIETSGIANNIVGLKSYNKNFIVYPNPAKNIRHVQTNGKAFL